MQGDGQGEGLHAGQEEGESRIIKCSPDTERESAVETISTRKGVSNHAQVQSNVGKKRAKIEDHPTSEGVCGSACFIRLGQLKKLLRCPKTR